jgi:hypothetical protein
MTIKIGNYDENTPGIQGDIFRKLQDKGYVHESYDSLANLPTKSGTETYLLFNEHLQELLLPGFEMLGSGAENHVFYNHNTRKINKYPKTTLTVLTTGGKEIHYTPLDILIQSIHKAVETNVAAIVLQTKDYILTQNLMA